MSKLTAHRLQGTPCTASTVPDTVLPSGSTAVTDVTRASATPTLIQPEPSVAVSRVGVPPGRLPARQPLHPS